MPQSFKKHILLQPSVLRMRVVLLDNIDQNI